MMLADAHCHLDLINRDELNNFINEVSIIITDSTDYESSIKNLELGDGRRIFPALGLDPEALARLSNVELDSMLLKIDSLIRENKKKIIAIGEVGLDYVLAKSDSEREMQRKVFEHFIDLSLELGKPMSIHSRNAIKDVMKILSKRDFKRAHFHYFEGDEGDARAMNELGYYVSVPPIESKKRAMAIKALNDAQIMAESDAPAIGRTPLDIKKSIEIIAKARELSFEKAAELTFKNTKRFFGID